MNCPFISDIEFDNIKVIFECPCEERLEDKNDNFSCEDCVHYQSVYSEKD